jgi:recombination protein RecA
VRENELFNLGVAEELIQKKGSWFFYVADDGKEYTLGQGKNNAVLFFAQNPHIAMEIERKIREKYNLPIGEKNAVK